MLKKELKIGIVGATGMVGQKCLDLLQDDYEHFNVKNLRLFARASSAGRVFPFFENDLVVEEYQLSEMSQCDVLFFAVDSEVSKKYIPELSQKGVLCIDKSSAYRENTEIPLIVPEVNWDEFLIEKLKKNPVIACPNCCVIPLVMILKPLHDEFILKRVVISTYQSVSGSGKIGCETLANEIQSSFENDSVLLYEKSTYPKPIAFNVLPFVTSILENGDTDEEDKIKKETKRILNLENLKISATSVRVPVYIGHSESVTLEFEKKFDLEKVFKKLSKFPGVKIVCEHQSFLKNDDIQTENENIDENNFGEFVSPYEAQGKNDIFVSRIRKTDVFENGISLWIVSDNLRKGAALNAIQTLDKCVQNGFFN